jgi:hypothetical protein
MKQELGGGDGGAKELGPGSSSGEPTPTESERTQQS